MNEIKTRQTVKDIRTLDRSANVADRMKNTYVRTKEQAEKTQQTNADSPAGYAEDRVTESAQDMSSKAGDVVRNQGKQLEEKIHQKIKNRIEQGGATGPEQSTVKARYPKTEQHKAGTAKASASQHKPYAAESNTTDFATHGHNFVRRGTGRHAERSVADYAGREPRRGVRTVERSIKQTARASEKTIKTSMRSSVKTAERSVKTAEKTSRAAIKTTQAAAKVAAKSAQATAKTAQKAAQAARAAAKGAAAAAKAIAKAVVVAVKSIAAAVKELIAAIAAGGWVAVLIIVVVLLVAAILGSVFGIFASEKGYDNDAPSMPDVVSQINSDFSTKIDSIIEINPHDKLVINNNGSASMVASWDEVLTIYDVLVATDPENPTEVATLDNAKIEKLKAVFWGMNNISYSVDVVQVGTDEKTGEPITETILTITVSYKSVEDMISYYGFNADRTAQVHELMKPEYAELFKRLTGSYQDITLSAAEIAEIIKTLPADLSEERKNVVLTAYSLLGKVHYFWGGKSLVLGWDNRWGTPMKVFADGSPSTGTVRPFGLDCSGFADWVFYNISGGKYVIGHGGGAESQYSYCDAISWDDTKPGDLAFYPGCEHVGIVVKNDAGTLTVIHCASGYDNVVMTQHVQGSGFAFVGRPKVYDK